MRKSDSPFIIPVFIPHRGCPHRCAFCNQTAITGSLSTIPDKEVAEREISQFLSYNRGNRFPVQIAFYGGNFLGLPPDEMRLLLETAERFIQSGQVESIRFSTRPDTIDPARLSMIAPFTVKTIEIGAQSMNDQVLEQANRGHTAEDTVTAVKLLRKSGYEIGLQMMIGLPGDSEERALETGRRIVHLKPDFVRIYPTLVIAGSLLAVSYEKGAYRPISLEESILWTKKLYRSFHEDHIRVIRMGLQADEELEKETTILAGPYHPAFGQMVHSALYLDRVLEMLVMIPGWEQRETLEIHVHPSQISTMRGQRKENVRILQNKYGFTRITVIPDPDLEPSGITVQ